MKILILFRLFILFGLSILFGLLGEWFHLVSSKCISIAISLAKKAMTIGER